MNRKSAEIQTIGIDDGGDGQQQPLVLGFTILHHPDTSRIGEVTRWIDVKTPSEIALGRLTPVFETVWGSPTEPLNTPFVSRTPVSFRADGKGNVTAHPAPNVKLLANGRSLNAQQHFPEAELEDGVVLRLADAVVLLLHHFDPNVRIHPDDLGMIGQNSAMQRVRTEILKVADLDTKVLIRGESGTGKELVAGAIHGNSRRVGRSFEKVNITEIPATIAERELFGAAKHAGTGEPGHDGYFIRADRGTLFLDEIGDVESAIQPKLLRAVETGEIQKLGAKTKTTVDVRILAGTDVDLEEAVRLGQFKSSLLVRLSGYTIHLPPLRKRREDIGRLFIHFLNRKLQELGEARKLALPEPGKSPWLPAWFVEKLARFNWPGNVRQLRNVATRIAVLGRGSDTFVRDDRLEAMLDSDTYTISDPPPTGQGRSSNLGADPLAAISDSQLIGYLEENGFNISRTVRQLGVERAKFYRHLKQQGIDIESLRADWTTR